jgi:hypothetical protein
MKTTLLICALFFTTFCNAQKYIVGIDLDAFSVYDYNASSTDKFSTANTTNTTKQLSTVLAPVVSLRNIKKDNIIYGAELGFYRYNIRENYLVTPSNSTGFYRGIASSTRYMYMLGFNCSKKVNFDKFIFIAGAHIPFSFSPLAKRVDNDTVYSTATNAMLGNNSFDGQMPKQFITGIRFRNELNYPLYKKLYIAAKLNFGFEYQHNFGKATSTSVNSDGSATNTIVRDINYKKMDIYGRHFSYSVGLNYFF